MKTESIIEGLQILQPYYEKSGGYNVGAEHDTLYAYATQLLSDEDLYRIVELGWFQEGIEWANEDKFQKEDYQVEEGWTCYV